MTWDNLVEIESQLRVLEFDLETHIELDGGNDPFCANVMWYGYDPKYLSLGGRSFKERLVLLVGDHASEPELRSSKAYSLAYDHLYNMIPDCKNCSCADFW